MNVKNLLLVGGAVVGGWWLLKKLAGAQPVPTTQAQAEAQNLYAKFQALVVGIPSEFEALDPDRVKGFKDQVARYKADNLDAGAAALLKGDANQAKYCFDALITTAPQNIVWVQQFLAGAPEALAALKRNELQTGVRSM